MIKQALRDKSNNQMHSHVISMIKSLSRCHGYRAHSIIHIVVTTPWSCSCIIIYKHNTDLVKVPTIDCIAWVLSWDYYASAQYILQIPYFHVIKHISCISAYLRISAHLLPVFVTHMQVLYVNAHRDIKHISLLSAHFLPVGI